MRIGRPFVRSVVELDRLLNRLGPGVEPWRWRRGPDAVAEFQKILDHPGVVINAEIVPLARAAYQDFFECWKDADPDIPILKQAKTEYAKLK